MELYAVVIVETCLSTGDSDSIQRLINPENVSSPRRHASFLSRISIGRTIDILPKLSSYLISDIDKLELALLYTDTLKDILLAKLAALSSYDTSYNISRLIQYL